LAARAAIHLHAFDYISKPVHKETITDIVGRAANEKRRRDAYDRFQEQRARYQQNLEAGIADRTARLQASEARFRLAEQIAHVGYYDIELATGTTTWSDETFRIMGLEPEKGRAPTAESYLKQVHPEDLSALSAMYEASVLQGELFDLVYRIIQPSGDTRHVHSRGHVTCDAEGQPIRMFGTLHDVTDRMNAEQALRHSEEALRTSHAQLEKQNEKLHISAEVLRILNDPLELNSAISDILAVIKREMMFDGVGIRLQSATEPPYVAHIGFPDALMDTGNRLAVGMQDGDLYGGADGATRLKCFCDQVLSGQPGLANSRVTARGSFWTNHASEMTLLPSGPVNHDLSTEDCCLGHGFHSVALIPIRVQGEIVGLFQLNDRAAGRFTQESIEFFEGLSDSIGIALTRKQAEDSLRVALVKLETLFDSIPMGVILSDAAGNVVEVNSLSESLLGVTREAHLARSIDRPPWRIVRPDGTPMPPQEFASVRALRERRPVRGVQMGAERPDGTVVWLDASAAPVPLEGYGVVATYADISQERHIEQELREQRRALYHMERVQTMGELASSLAHEVSQPLSGILSNAQAAQCFLAETSPDMDEIRDILADIVADDKRAGDIVGRMRAMLNKNEPQLAPFDINEAIHETLAFARMDLALQGVATRTKLAVQPLLIRGDRTQIQQVLLNLILNATQAIAGRMNGKEASAECGATDAERDGGEAQIMVATRCDDSAVVTVMVKDSGPGISDEAMGCLFDSFYTTKANGMGMGLTICRSIVTAHEGRIWAENHPEGGAVFAFTLIADCEGGD